MQGAIEPQQSAFNRDVAGEVVGAVELQNALVEGRTGKTVIAAQAQPADTVFVQPPLTVDIIAPIVPGATLPDHGAACATVHLHAGIDPQLPRPINGFFEVDQPPAIHVIDTGRAKVLSGGQQHITDLRVVQVREALHQQPQRARYLRGGHGGA